MASKFYTSVEEESKLKFRKFLGLIPTFVGVTGEKLVGRVLSQPPSPSPILNRVKDSLQLNEGILCIM